MSIKLSDATVKFARDLVTTGELDPVYNLIYGGRQRYGDDWGYKFALHFFMYYDLGQAAALANAQTELDFWHMQNYGYEDFKRGSERRHFRGDKGREAMLNFQRRGSPERIWKTMYKPTYHALYENIRSNFQGCQIGDYFTWKVMDIFDRCLDMPVALDRGDAMNYLPYTPRKAAREHWRGAFLDEVLEAFVDVIEDLPAPGAPTRGCSYAEAETILCAVYGSVKGTYVFGSDIAKRRAQLADHPYLLDLLPTIPEKQYGQALDPSTVSA